MALPTAHAPHSGPVDQPGEQAYLWARSGIARSATTRSNYVSIQNTIDWIVRDEAGAIISTTDISGVILQHSLQITQALNDEPDTCSFTLKPQAPPAAVPQVGQEIRITWAPGAPPLFHGYILVAQSDWRLTNLQPPWIAIQCQDPMWRFDARIVTYRFPAQSVSDSIAFLVKYFCNVDPAVPSGLDFSTAFVEQGMPAIPAFDVVNQRPSTVMRTLTASVGGGFYLEGLIVHAWANSVSEPNQPNPQPLTVGLKSLYAFRRTEDATQVRRRVLVEGRRSSTRVSLPDLDADHGFVIGAAIEDASLFALATDDAQLTRFGTQWVNVRRAVSPTMTGQNPPQTKSAVAYTPGDLTLTLHALPAGLVPPPYGWIRVGNQYQRYASVIGDPAVDTWAVELFVPDEPLYGYFTVPIAAEEIVEWVDAANSIQSQGLSWVTPNDGDPYMRAHPVDTPVVVLAVAQTTLGPWPPLEGFVQDGRYSYAGAQARADDDLAGFKDPLVAVEWQTDDLNALPGRSQVIALSSAAVNPPINTIVTILRVDLSFPLRTLPPRRSCTGGIVKPSSFMDLVVTTTN